MAVTVVSTVRTDVIVLVAATVCQFFMNPAKSSTGLFTSAFIQEYNATIFEVAWIGSVQRGFLASMALPAVAMMEYFGTGRPMVIASALLFATFLASAYSSHLGLTVALYAINGLCLSMFGCASKTMVSIYFQKYRQLAYTIIVCGASAGGFTMTFGVAGLLGAFGLRESQYFLSSLAVPLFVVSLIFFYYCPFRSVPMRKHITDNVSNPSHPYIEQVLRNFRFIAAASVQEGSLQAEALFPHSPVDDFDVHEYLQMRADEKQNKTKLSGPGNMFRDERLYIFIASRTLHSIGHGITDLLTTDMLLVVFETPISDTSYFIIAGAIGNMVGRIGSIPLCFVKFSRLFSYIILCSAHAAMLAAFPHTNFIAVCVMGLIVNIISGYQTSANGQVPLDIFGKKQAHRLIALSSTAGGIGFIIGAPIAGALQKEFGYVEAYAFAACAYFGVAVLNAVLYFHPRTKALRKETASREQEPLNEDEKKAENDTQLPLTEISHAEEPTSMDKEHIPQTDRTHN